VHRQLGTGRRAGCRRSAQASSPSSDEASNEAQLHETPQDLSQGVLRGGRDLKLCVNAGPTGTEGDPANDSALLRLTQNGEPEPRRTGEGCACHNVTDDRAELIALVLSTALAKWRSSPDPAELRGILLRLLVALEGRA
jgi:hypothetical protein